METSCQDHTTLFPTLTVHPVSPKYDHRDAVSVVTIHKTVWVVLMPYAFLMPFILIDCFASLSQGKNYQLEWLVWWHMNI